MAHVADWKKDKLEDLKQLIGSSPVVGIVSVDGIPGPQLQNMRRNLRTESPFIVCKNNLIKLAITELAEERKGFESLLELVGTSQNGLIASDKNPFKLFAELKATESKAAAKGGEIAPEDIGIKAGDTPFKPGPIVGDLQKAGIPAAIMSGKVVIKKDKILVKEGDVITPELAGALTRLDIMPMTVGLKLKGAFEEGTVFDSSVLDIDPMHYHSQITQIASGGFNLAMHLAWTTPTTIMPLLSKARMDAFNLAMNAGVINTDTIKLLVSKAQGEMLALASNLGDGLDEELSGMLQNRPAPSGDGGSEETEAKEEEKQDEEEEKVSEEDAAAGLGALFG